MSYTRLVAYSAVPGLMMLGFLGGGDGFALAVLGVIIEAFVLARFFDRKAKAPAPRT